MVNEDYIDEDPFVHKYEGLPVESLNLFILMGGLLEGMIDVNVPEHFKKKVWDSDEIARRARFCKFTLANMKGENTGDTLVFNKDQTAIIKVEIFMQMLDKITRLELSGSKLDSLKVNMLKNYPMHDPSDVIFEDMDLTTTDINILDSQLEDDSFYLELVATDDNIVLECISLTIKTKKLGGGGDVNMDGNHIYIDGDRSNTLPIFTANEFEKLFNKYVKRDLNTIEEANTYIEDPNTPKGAIVLLPKEAL